MRHYPHNPDPQVVESSFEANAARLVPERDMTPDLLAGRSELFFQLNADAAMACAAQAYALEQPLSVVRVFLDEAAASVYRWLDTSHPMDPSAYLYWLGVALIVRDKLLASRMAALPRSRYTHPDILSDEAWYLAAESLAGLAAQADASQVLACVSGARQRLGRLPKLVRNEFAAGLDLSESVVRRDPDTLDAAVGRRASALAAKFTQERIRNMPQGLLDPWGLGLLRLARDAGLDWQARPVCLPAQLLEAD